MMGFIYLIENGGSRFDAISFSAVRSAPNTLSKMPPSCAPSKTSRDSSSQVLVVAETWRCRPGDHPSVGLCCHSAVCQFEPQGQCIRQPPVHHPPSRSSSSDSISRAEGGVRN